MLRAITVHRWGGDSESDWIPWLGEELKKRDVEVIAPDMPNTKEPTIESWVPFLSSIVKEADEETFFVGHSIGCQAIIRYLQTLPPGKRVGGAVFVAGFLSIKNLQAGEEGVVKQWLETPIDWGAAASHTSSFVCIYSDNDPFVPMSDAEVFKEKLNAKLVLDSNRGHFTEREDITQLPSVLDELLLIMGLPVETRLL